MDTLTEDQIALLTAEERHLYLIRQTVTGIPQLRTGVVGLLATIAELRLENSDLRLRAIGAEAQKKEA